MYEPDFRFLYYFSVQKSTSMLFILFHNRLSKILNPWNHHSKYSALRPDWIISCVSLTIIILQDLFTAAIYTKKSYRSSEVMRPATWFNSDGEVSENGWEPWVTRGVLKVVGKSHARSENYFFNASFASLCHQQGLKPTNNTNTVHGKYRLV